MKSRITAEPRAPSIDSWQRLAPRTIDLGHWELIWRANILTSFLSHLNETKDLFTTAYQNRITRSTELLPESLFRNPFFKHPYAVANALATGPMPRRIQLTASDPRWDEIEETVRACDATAVQPILIEIDHLDDYFENSPSVMAETQAGLALYLTRLAKDPFIDGGRLRIHATVRSSTHRFLIAKTMTTVLREASVIEIVWTKQSIQAVLDQSIHSSGAPRLAEVAGAHHVQVPLRGVTEPLEEYLLRHTTLTPRGAEQLSRAVLAKWWVDRSLSASDLRRAVVEHAEMLASSVIQQLTSDLRALGSGSPTGGRIQSDPTVQFALKDQLVTALERLDSDVISWNQLQVLVEEWDTTTRPYLADCLWAHRLIGRYDHTTHQLLISHSVGDRLGRESNELLLHPILLHLCSSITPTQEAIEIEYVR